MRKLIGTLAAAVLFMTPQAGRAQSACRPFDPDAANLMGYLTRVISDPAYDDDRRDLQLHSGTSADVELILDDTICAAAVTAYNLKVNSNAQRAVIVVRVGLRYVVEDPTVLGTDGSTPTMIFDKNWRFLTWYA